MSNAVEKVDILVDGLLDKFAKSKDLSLQTAVSDAKEDIRAELGTSSLTSEEKLARANRLALEKEEAERAAEAKQKAAEEEAKRQAELEAAFVPWWQVKKTV